MLISAATPKPATLFTEFFKLIISILAPNVLLTPPERRLNRRSLYARLRVSFIKG
jgi:hypothetical protein